MSTLHRQSQMNCEQNKKKLKWKLPMSSKKIVWNSPEPSLEPWAEGLVPAACWEHWLLATCSQLSLSTTCPPHKVTPHFGANMNVSAMEVKVRPFDQRYLTSKVPCRGQLRTYLQSTQVHFPPLPPLVTLTPPRVVPNQLPSHPSPP